MMTLLPKLFLFIANRNCVMERFHSAEAPLSLKRAFFPVVSGSFLSISMQTSYASCFTKPCSTSTTSCTKSCWSCTKKLDPKDKMMNFFCPFCRTVQPVSTQYNFFQLFGCPETFDINLEEITGKYREMQRALHPDMAHQKSQVELFLFCFSRKSFSFNRGFC